MQVMQWQRGIKGIARNLNHNGSIHKTCGVSMTKRHFRINPSIRSVSMIQKRYCSNHHPQKSEKVFDFGKKNTETNGTHSEDGNTSESSGKKDKQESNEEEQHNKQQRDAEYQDFIKHFVMVEFVTIGSLYYYLFFVRPTKQSKKDATEMTMADYMDPDTREGKWYWIFAAVLPFTIYLWMRTPKRF